MDPNDNQNADDQNTPVPPQDSGVPVGDVGQDEPASPVGEPVGGESPAHEEELPPPPPVVGDAPASDEGTGDTGAPA